MGIDGDLLLKGNGKPRFLYKQLADALRQEIDRGVFISGDMLPSMDDLAARYSINKATVRQAINELVHSGLIYSVPAKGTFVSDVSEPAVPGRLDCLTIGWISSVPDKGCTGGYHTEMMQAAHQAVQRTGGRFVVFSSNGMSYESFWEMIRQARLDGALLVGSPNQQPLLHLLNDSMPAVILNDRFLGRRISSIYIDNEDGGFLALDHLLVQGHRKLAMVTGPREMRLVRERIMGAEMACVRYGLQPEQVQVVESDFTPEGGMRAMKELLGARERPTGVFFFNDEMACGALRFLYEETDCRVPEDFSIIGFDDISWARLSHPPLTTVHVETELMGRKAVDMLADLVRSQEVTGAANLVIPVRIEARRSTRRLTQDSVDNPKNLSDCIA